jgi:hypothetical protein
MFSATPGWRGMHDRSMRHLIATYREAARALDSAARDAADVAADDPHLPEAG